MMDAVKEAVKMSRVARQRHMKVVVEDGLESADEYLIFYEG